MKLQYLSIIFLIIILPIVMVLSVYVDYHIDAINLKHTYDTKLLDSTYDALKSYQLNTINNAISDISTSKIDDIEAAVEAFYNSLTNNFGYTGYNSSVMEEYVPAVVFAMYDGYYIYSPYKNTLTGVNENGVDENYKGGSILEGLKPYVYYSCRYKNNDKYDVVITYTLDNYITIQGIVNGKYENKYGYLINGISVDDSDPNEVYLKYDGVKYTLNISEKLQEYVGEDLYCYAKLNGTKYYLDETNEEVFYINRTGEKAVQASSGKNEAEYDKYKTFIGENNSAYKYYQAAYDFTRWVEDNLKGLSSQNAVDAEGNKITSFQEYEIFGKNEYIQDSDSNFNQHRAEVIRYTIEKNLSTAIAGYNSYFKNSESNFIMPNLSETDWEIVENNISMITFLQGFKIGGRDYNEYCVIANNLNKEYIDEKDIYILTDKTYYKANDNNLNLNSKSSVGIWKLNFESRKNSEGKYYPLKDCIGSYSSIITSTSVDYSNSDMYKYLRAINTNDNINDDKEILLKELYYTALGRERYGHYSVNNNKDISKMLN